MARNIFKVAAKVSCLAMDFKLNTLLADRGDLRLRMADSTEKKRFVSFFTLTPRDTWPVRNESFKQKLSSR